MQPDDRNKPFRVVRASDEVHLEQQLNEIGAGYEVSHFVAYPDPASSNEHLICVLVRKSKKETL